MLKLILQLVAKDEVRHCQFAYDLLQLELKKNPENGAAVLDESRRFRHIGELVVPNMPVAQKNDFAAIVAINRKIQRLTGQTIGGRLPDVVA